MSRLAKNPIPVPAGVTALVNGQSVSAKGKAERVHVIHNDIAVELKDGHVTLSIKAPEPTQQMRAQWGTDHALVRSLFKGVSQGFTKTMVLNGVGYRAAVEGNVLVMQLGFSHPIRYTIPEGIKIAVDKTTIIAVTGADAQRVGQVCAEIRKYRPPEPYKGKGIRFEGENVRRKEGKKK